MFYLALDLDELDEVPRRVRIVGRNRPNILTFRDADHLDPPADDLAASVLDHLRQAGEHPEGWRITLVTNLRVLGYVFNPASFYLCRDRDGVLRVVIVEVHNTHGERHLYTLRPERVGPDFVSSMEKGFYVSPFIDAVGSYTVRVRDEARASPDHDQRGERGFAPAPHQRRPGQTPLELARRRRDAGSASVRHAQDDRHDPPPRAAPVASRCAIPSPRAGGIVTSAASTNRVGRIAVPVLAQSAERALLAAASKIRVGRLEVTLPDGSRQAFGDAEATERGEIHLHDRAAYLRMLIGGETGAGEAYVDGLWSSPDLPALLRVGARNRDALALSSGLLRAPDQLRRTIAHRLRRNTRSNARRNISAHYDLGNDFYRLWLDETMTYSSAVFDSPDQSLADAQRNKYRLIAEGAGVGPGSHVLEIGSGWGGFALYAAGELGCRVTSITISREQADLARARVRAAGLEDLVEIQLRDYRDIEGTYDAVVSIEMLEAVGAEYFAAFFLACSRALAPGGHLSLQTITVPDVGYRRQVSGANWIQRYIFPGGALPSLAAIERSLHGTGFVVTGVRDIAADYVRTLRAWRSAFMARRDDVVAMGFDDRFIRTWDYYLAISEAGFATGVTQDLQIVLEKRLYG